MRITLPLLIGRRCLRARTFNDPSHNKTSQDYLGRRPRGENLGARNWSAALLSFPASLKASEREAPGGRLRAYFSAAWAAASACSKSFLSSITSTSSALISRRFEQSVGRFIQPSVSGCGAKVTYEFARRFINRLAPEVVKLSCQIDHKFGSLECKRRTVLRCRVFYHPSSFPLWTIDGFPQEFSRAIGTLLAC